MSEQMPSATARIDVEDLVAECGDPAFAVDSQGLLLAWNGAAARLLGVRESEVRGKRCYQIVCGRDPFGNRFCGRHCPVVRMACRKEPVRHFELALLTASREIVRVVVSVLVVRGIRPSDFVLVHLLQPLPDRAVGGDSAFSGTGENQVATPADPPRDRPPAPVRPLTHREAEILRALDRGESTRQIARGLCISAKTVRNHVESILKKLGAHSRIEAVAVARHHRLT